MRIFFQILDFENICRRLFLRSVFLMAFVSSSCTLERFFPEEVANGVARLSVSNFGNLVRAVNELPSTDSRTECKLTSLAQTERTTIERTDNEHGTVIWQFSDCEDRKSVV